jgi:hypothetical protein
MITSQGSGSRCLAVKENQEAKQGALFRKSVKAEENETEGPDTQQGMFAALFAVSFISSAADNPVTTCAFH